MKNWRSVWSITSHCVNSVIENNIIQRKHKNMMRPDYHVINQFVKYDQGGNPLKVMDRINKNNLGCTASFGLWKLDPIVSNEWKWVKYLYGSIYQRTDERKKGKKGRNKEVLEESPSLSKSIVQLALLPNIDQHQHQPPSWPSSSLVARQRQGQ